MALTTATTLGALLLQRVASHSLSTAVRWDHDDTRWGRLDYQTLAQRVASMVAAVPVARGERVAWLGFNHPGQIALLLALAQRGALLVPLNHRQSPADWAAVVADCTPTMLLHDHAFAEPAQALATATGMQALSIDDVPLNVHATTPDTSQPDDAVLLAYTAGTTDMPKGAVHTQASLLAQLAVAARVQGLGDADTVLCALPLFDMAGPCVQALPALGVGAAVLLHRRFDPAAVLGAIERDRPTLTRLAPAQLQALTQHPRWAATHLRSLRAIWAGWGPLPAATVQACAARGLPVCNVYGTAETGGLAIALGPEHALSHLGSCGWPVPGVDVKLVDTQDEDVVRGRAGEICVRGPGVAQRWWPDVAALDADGFFHSGDLGMSDGDGSITVVGRARDMIVSGGEHIHPAEIEHLLMQHPWVAVLTRAGLAGGGRKRRPPASG